MPTAKQKLARRRNWSVFQLKGAIANVTECINTAASHDPEHRGLMELQSARSFLRKALRAIKRQEDQ